MQQFQNLDKCRQIPHAPDPQPRQQCPGPRIAPGQRCSVRHRRPLRLFRRADLQRDQRHTAFRCQNSQPMPRTGIAKPFDMQPDRRHTRIFQQPQRNFRLRRLRHVSAGHDIGNWQPALLHRQVDGNVRALRQDRHTAVHTCTSMLIRPQQRTVQRIDVPIAIRPQHGHFARRSHQLRLQIGPARILGSRLGKARGKAYRPARAHPRQPPHDVNRNMPVHTHKNRVGCLWQILNRRHRNDPLDHRSLGVNDMNFTRKPHKHRLFDHLRAPCAATHHGNRPWPQQPRQITHHTAPSFGQKYPGGRPQAGGLAPA